MKEIFMSLPPWARFILVMLVIILLIFASYKGYKFVVNFFNKSKDLTKDAEDQLNKNNLSYSDMDYESMASTLEIALKGTWTDYEPIKTVMLRLKNRDDWAALVIAFGVRTNKHTIGSDFTGNLTEWLVDELGTTFSSEYSEISQILSKIGVQL